MKLTAHLHLVPRLRIGGAVPADPIFFVMKWCLIKHMDEKLEVETEEEIDADAINLLRSEVGRAVKEMRDTKATRDNNVCGDRLKFLGEYSLQLMAQLFSNMCETEE